MKRGFRRDTHGARSDVQTRPPQADKRRGKVSTSLIRLTRINHVAMVLNSDLIEHIETTPDTVISLTNGQKLVVLETVDEIIDRVVEFRRRIRGSE